MPSPPEAQTRCDTTASSAAGAVSPIRESDEHTDPMNDRDLSSTSCEHKSTQAQIKQGPLQSTRLPRLSEIRSQTSSESSERPHSPCPDSFSQLRPRAHQTSALANHEQATASTVALYEPKCTPDLVHIRRASSNTLARNTSVRSAHCPTFGARRLDDPADFAALLENSPTRRESCVVPAPLASSHRQYDDLVSDISADNSGTLSDSILAMAESPLIHDLSQISGMPVTSAFDDSTMSVGDDATGDLVPLRLDIPTQKRPDRPHIVDQRDGRKTPPPKLLPLDNVVRMTTGGSQIAHPSPGTKLTFTDESHQEALNQLEGNPIDSRHAIMSHADSSRLTTKSTPVSDGRSSQLPSYAQQTTASQRRRSGGFISSKSLGKRISGPLPIPSKALSILDNAAGVAANGRKRAAPAGEVNHDVAANDSRRSTTSSTGKVCDFPQSPIRVDHPSMPSPRAGLS